MKSTLPHAASPANIQAGFACTGIWPFNRNIFSDGDFAPSRVTDSRWQQWHQRFHLPPQLHHPMWQLWHPPCHLEHHPLSHHVWCPSLSLSSAHTLPWTQLFHPSPSVHTQKLAQEADNKGQEKKGTAVLTDIPVKKQLEAEKSRSAAKRKNNFSNKKKNQNPRGRKFRTHLMMKMNSALCTWRASLGQGRSGSNAGPVEAGQQGLHRWKGFLHLPQLWLGLGLPSPPLCCWECLNFFEVFYPLNLFVHYIVTAPSWTGTLSWWRWFEHPNDPRSYVVRGLMPLVGSPKANRS